VWDGVFFILDNSLSAASVSIGMIRGSAKYNFTFKIQAIAIKPQMPRDL
jgi:hypothetical protein